MKKVIINYGKLRESESYAMGRSVYQGMNGNASFPNPAPSMPVFLQTLDDYGQAITDAKTRDRNDVARKNTLQQTVISMMRDLAMYVNAVSKGSLVMLTSSGFTVAKDREPVYIGEPVITDVLQGINPGSIIVKIKAVKGAKSYLYEVAPDPINEQTEWTTIADSRVKFEFTGLEQGKKYWFRVVATGSKGQSVYSEEVAQYVLQRTISQAA